MAKTFLMVIVLSLFGCKEEALPVTHFYSPVLRFKKVNGVLELNVERSFCAKYRLIDRQNIKFDRGEKRPLHECNGMFGMSAGETGNALDFIRDKIKKNLHLEAELL